VQLLHPHPDFRASQPYIVNCTAIRRGSELRLGFRLSGYLANVVLPPRTLGERRDELWKTTCFEVFAGFAGRKGYREFNMSPSGHWAAYDFDDYRSGMHRADPSPRRVWQSRKPVEFRLNFTVPLVVEMTRLALSAVIEEIDGTKSYWALRHPPGPPDFHHADCFALELAAPKVP